MEAFWSSCVLVAIAEMGDKTQLLALMLTMRFRKPWTVLAGILVATLGNHALASQAGVYLSRVVPTQWLAGILAVVFFAFAVWVLIPDKEDDLNTSQSQSAFWTAVITFFLAEMGDKTQLATVALGAQFQNLTMVTLGTTIGMLAANAPAVFLGNRFRDKIPMRAVHLIAALLFGLFGALILLREFGVGR